MSGLLDIPSSRVGEDHRGYTDRPPSRLVSGPLRKASFDSRWIGNREAADCDDEPIAIPTVLAADNGELANPLPTLSMMVLSIVCLLQLYPAFYADEIDRQCWGSSCLPMLPDLFSCLW